MENSEPYDTIPRSIEAAQAEIQTLRQTRKKARTGYITTMLCIGVVLFIVVAFNVKHERRIFAICACVVLAILALIAALGKIGGKIPERYDTLDVEEYTEKRIAFLEGFIKSTKVNGSTGADIRKP